MADSYIVYIKVDDQTDIPVKVVDLGDGTFAFAVSGQGTTSPTAAAIATAVATALGAQAEDAALASGHTGIPVLTQRKDTASASAGSDGDAQDLITDANGRLHTTNPSVDATNSLTKIVGKCTQGTVSGAADAQLVTGQGVLFGVDITNGSASPTTCQLYDNTSAAVPKISCTIALPANTTIQLRWNYGIPFTTGVWIDFATATTCDAQAYYGPAVV